MAKPASDHCQPKERGGRRAASVFGSHINVLLAASPFGRAARSAPPVPPPASPTTQERQSSIRYPAQQSNNANADHSPKTGHKAWGSYQYPFVSCLTKAALMSWISLGMLCFHALHRSSYAQKWRCPVRSTIIRKGEVDLRHVRLLSPDQGDMKAKSAETKGKPLIRLYPPLLRPRESPTAGSGAEWPPRPSGSAR